MMPNSFLIQLGKPSFERAGAVFANNAISLWLNKPNDRFIKISHFETGFVIFVGETCHEEPHQSTGSEIPAGTFITTSSSNATGLVRRLFTGNKTAPSCCYRIEKKILLLKQMNQIGPVFSNTYTPALR
jgi:hypothetical protein